MYSDKVMDEFRHPHNLGELKDPDGIGKVGNPVCLPVGSMVHANDEFMPIDSLKVGEKLLGGDGHYNRIQRTLTRNYAGELVRIKNKLGITYLTPEHEVLAVKIPKRQKYLHAKWKKTLPISWHHAAELEKGDLAVYPVMLEEEDKEFIPVPTEKKKYDYKSKRVPEKIPVDSKFLRLCGYYLAEGYLREKTTKVAMGLAFNSRETDLVADVEKIVKNLFGVEAKRKTIEKRRTLKVEINNVFVVRLFKPLFGNGAANKKIPHWMMLLPAEKQKSLLYGLWKGDGFVNKKIPRAGYSTISYQLMQQIKTLLLRQKIVPSIYTEEAHTTKDGVKHRKVYRIHVGERKSLLKLAKILNENLNFSKPAATDSWFDGNRLLIPITRVGRAHYSGEVHNLEIENSKSYVTESLAVHNCGDLMWVYIKVAKNKKGEEIIKDAKVKTFGCLPPKEKIVLGKEWKNIDSIEAGQELVNGDGLRDICKKTFKIPYEGKMLTFVPFVSSYNSFLVTPEHPVLAVKREKVGVGKCLYGKSKWLKSNKIKIYKVGPEFIKAGDLNAGDYLIFRYPKESKDDSSLSKDLMRLLGYYLSEGYPIAKGNATAFAFHKNEKALIEEVEKLVKKLADKKIGRRTRGNVTEVYFCSKRFTDFLISLGGKGARKKKLSEKIMLLPPEKQLEMIKTFWAGDGDITVRRKGNSPTYRLATASEELAIQFQEILARNGIFSSISERQRIEHFIEGRRVTGSRLFLVKYKISRSHQFVHSVKDYFLVPIKKIAEKPYKGFVYNLELPNKPNSYLVKGFVTHNCVAAIATSSKLTEMVKGMTLEEALKIDKDKIAKELDGLPPVKMHCSVLSMDGLRKAIEDYRNKKANREK